jgi:hypothetical protein
VFERKSGASVCKMHGRTREKGAFVVEPTGKASRSRYCLVLAGKWGLGLVDEGFALTLYRLVLAGKGSVSTRHVHGELSSRVRVGADVGS